MTERHDHGDCIATALESANRLCSAGGARLTELRERVLREVWRGHDAVKAYDILDALSESERNAKPPTVYRALQFLQAHGLVHRLESLNAFVGCARPSGSHEGQFLICRACGEVREEHAPAIAQAVSETARRARFDIDRQMVEVLGTCAHCR